METKQSDLIKAALENVKSIVDANTVTGTPITTDSGTVIIPVSKIFIGVTTGGVDFFDRTGASDNSGFGGGGGTGVTLSPVGFLVIDPSGNVELLNLNAEPKDVVSHVFDFIQKSPELIKKIKSILDTKKEAEEE